MALNFLYKVGCTKAQGGRTESPQGLPTPRVHVSWKKPVSPGADLGDVMRMFYMTVGRGSALYSPMEHRNMPENNPIRLSRRAQLIDWPTDPGLRSRTPTRASRQPRTNQHVSRQQLGGHGVCASSRPRPWLVSLWRGQDWAARKPRIKIGTRGPVDSSPLHQHRSDVHPQFRNICIETTLIHSTEWLWRLKSNFITCLLIT